MDATVGYINISQNKRINWLTVIGVVFARQHLAGMGGMSGFSHDDAGHACPGRWPYGAFLIVSILMSSATYVAPETLWNEESTQRRRRRHGPVRRDEHRACRTTPGDAPDKPVPSGVPERGVHLALHRDTRKCANDGPGTGAPDRRAGLSVEWTETTMGDGKPLLVSTLGAPGRAGA
ncbi:MAG: hypothetical protein IPH64_13200 [Comamonadaceae bacterium]|nr:hypothetical protein [Comamonadaceae bacterium]